MYLKNGQWILNNTLNFGGNSKWVLEGKWNFDIMTYYVEVIIRSVDWTTMQAQVEYRGSVWHGGGEVHSATVKLMETEGELWFSPLVIPAEDYLSDDRYITLCAKLDDMYYETPSIFRGEPDMLLPIGGRTQ